MSDNEYVQSKIECLKAAVSLNTCSNAGAETILPVAKELHKWVTASWSLDHAEAQQNENPASQETR